MVTKLTITPCDVDASGTVTGTRDRRKFTVMLNPSSFKHDKSINYAGMTKSEIEKSGKIPMGTSAATPRFKNTGSEKLSFSVTIDGTGVVPGVRSDVRGQLGWLNDVVYKYEGDSHEPNIVQVVWGTFKFTGRLTSMATEYTLFKPTGEPLRAKVALAFTDYVSIKEEALKANRSSPDLTHSVEVKAGDTLPLLCFRIYKNSAYYMEIAKINGITNFRNIPPGARLHFPPLR